jgi:hypothetical protein
VSCDNAYCSGGQACCLTGASTKRDRVRFVAQLASTIFTEPTCQSVEDAMRIARAILAQAEETEP